MGKLILSLALLLPLFEAPALQDVERAFLQNNARMLFHLLPAESYIHISLPPPISFSDHVSNHQAYFLLKRIFTTYSTFEFYAEQHPAVSQSENIILKARWSFKNKKNDNQYAFNIFFNLQKREVEQDGERLWSWRIVEIKAEKI